MNASQVAQSRDRPKRRQGGALQGEATCFAIRNFQTFDTNTAHCKLSSTILGLRLDTLMEVIVF
jgi:hypothetical protein